MKANAIPSFLKAGIEMPIYVALHCLITSVQKVFILLLTDWYKQWRSWTLRGIDGLKTMEMPSHSSSRFLPKDWNYFNIIDASVFIRIKFFKAAWLLLSIIFLYSSLAMKSWQNLHGRLRRDWMLWHNQSSHCCHINSRKMLPRPFLQSFLFHIFLIFSYLYLLSLITFGISFKISNQGRLVLLFYTPTSYRCIVD